jgi:osmotically-inducible protein OsmY
MRKSLTIKLLWAFALGSMASMAGTVVTARLAVAEGSSPKTMATSADQERANPDKQLQDKVQNALRSDAFFYGAHVDVSLENGSVVLRGFVFSDWDLRDAIRIATKAAGGRRVIDDLTIEVGGRR